LARPHVALITNVGRAHIGFLGSLGAIRKAKLEVAEGLDPDGWLLVPGDDSALAAGARRTGRRVLTFGPAPADCIVRRIERVGPFAHEIELAGYPPARVESPARATALAGIAALATVSVLGVDPTGAASALSAWRPAPGRMAVHERDGVIILDDSYNANPDSMRAALETLSEMPCDGRRIAVLGDMRELGEHSAACHRELGLRLGSADVVYLVGEEVRETESAAKTARPACDVRRFTDRREVARIVKAELRRGDVVLVKGSRAMQLDLVVGVLRGVEAR
jgi:UDP-N-acetylmuramoyl-tripeptide--D-alanyl-D-alanine ligase